MENKIAPMRRANHAFGILLGCAMVFGLLFGGLAARADNPSPQTGSKPAPATPPALPTMAVNDPDYVIGVDDVVSITALGNSEVDELLVVQNDGNIEVNGIPTAIHAAGMTIAQLQDVVYKGLSKLFNNLNVAVSVKESHSRYVTIIGAKASGQFFLRNNMHVSELIAAAGGPPIPKIKYVVGALVRNFQKITLDIPKICGGKHPDPAADLLLQPRDYVVLDTHDEAPPPSFSVIGAVEKSGSYLLPLDGSPFTVAQAISVSGGRTTIADLGKVSLLRDGKKTVLNLHPFLVEGKADAPEAKVELKDGDVLLFPEAQAKYMVVGQVNHPASFPLPQSEKITIVRALADAGGPTPMSELRKAGIVRVVDGKATFIKIDLHKMITKAKLDNSIVMQDGDVLYVPQKGKQISISDVLAPFYILTNLGFHPFL